MNICKVPREEAVRNIVVSLILTIITCGLYDLYWNAKQMKTMNGLREKARMPRALHGDEWPLGVWGYSPQLELAFSLEEAPTLVGVLHAIGTSYPFGRGF